jgi:hypothetical protein
MTHLSSTKKGARQRILNIASPFVLFSIKVKEELKDRKENVEGTGKRENTLCEPI